MINRPTGRRRPAGRSERRRRRRPVGSRRCASVTGCRGPSPLYCSPVETQTAMLRDTRRGADCIPRPVDPGRRRQAPRTRPTADAAARGVEPIVDSTPCPAGSQDRRHTDRPGTTSRTHARPGHPDRGGRAPQNGPRGARRGPTAPARQVRLAYLRATPTAPTTRACTAGRTAVSDCTPAAETKARTRTTLRRAPSGGTKHVVPDPDSNAAVAVGPPARLLRALSLLESTRVTATWPARAEPC